MKELVVISGKGGTGKTSLLASFAALATGRAVLADCDVDAADLHLVLAPTVRRRESFQGGHEAVIRQADCTGCGVCLARCRFGAVLRVDGAAGGRQAVAHATCNACVQACDRSCPNKFSDMVAAIKKASGREQEPRLVIDASLCEGCGVCVWSCPEKAIDFPERCEGEWFVSDTRHGPMVHARLFPGGENSGKLVSQVREAARTEAAETQANLILVDGPPGIGCAVIASITGASRVLVVTEPTLSGAHDLARVLELTRHFEIETAVCVNKWDVNPEQTAQIEAQALAAGATIAGRVRYDRGVTAAQIRGLSVVEAGADGASEDIRAVWEAVRA